MKKGRRVVAIILGLLLCLTLFASCKKDEPATPTTSGTSPAQPSTSSNTGGGTSASPAAPTPSAASELEAAPPEEPGQTFRDHINVIIDATPISVLNPFAAAGTGMSTNWAYGMIYNRLIEMREDGTYVPALATSWSTDDYQTYIFNLRDDVTWHNGDHFTANDVVWSWATAVADAGGFPSWDYWMRIESARAIDDYTLELVTKTVNVDFYYGLSIMYCGILNERAVAADNEKGWWVGTGAYIVTDFSSRDYVEFVRNDNYWGELPLTRTQRWVYIPEMTTRTIMLQNGEADICFELAETDLDIFSNDPNFIFLRAGGLNCFSLQLNQDKPLMSDHFFKLAVVHALDRDEISLFASGDLAIMMEAGAVWGLTWPHRNNDLPVQPTDLDLARDYLAQSSYNGEEVVLTTALPYNIRAAEAVQQQLGRIGINVVINQLDMAGFTSATVWGENHCDMVIWANLLGASNFGYLNNFRIGAVHNRAKVQIPELEEILLALPTMTDVNDRDAAWKRAQQIVYDDMSCIPIYRRASGIVAVAGTGGLELPAHGLNDLRYMYILEG